MNSLAAALSPPREATKLPALDHEGDAFYGKLRANVELAEPPREATASIATTASGCVNNTMPICPDHPDRLDRMRALVRVVRAKVHCIVLAHPASPTRFRTAATSSIGRAGDADPAASLLVLRPVGAGEVSRLPGGPRAPPRPRPPERQRPRLHLRPLAPVPRRATRALSALRHLCGARSPDAGDARRPHHPGRWSARSAVPPVRCGAIAVSSLPRREDRDRRQHVRAARRTMIDWFEPIRAEFQTAVVDNNPAPPREATDGKD